MKNMFTNKHVCIIWIITFEEPFGEVLNLFVCLGKIIIYIIIIKSKTL